MRRVGKSRTMVPSNNEQQLRESDIGWMLTYFLQYRPRAARKLNCDATKLPSMHWRDVDFPRNLEKSTDCAFFIDTELKVKLPSFRSALSSHSVNSIVYILLPSLIAERWFMQHPFACLKCIFYLCTADVWCHGVRISIKAWLKYCGVMRPSTGTCEASDDSDVETSTV